MTTQVYVFRPTILEAIRDSWPGRDRAKKIGRLINLSPRSVENWLQERAAPNTEQLIELMAVSPAVESAVARYVSARRAAHSAIQAAEATHERCRRHVNPLAGTDDPVRGAWDGVDRRRSGSAGSQDPITVTRRGRVA